MTRSPCAPGRRRFQSAYKCTNWAALHEHENSFGSFGQQAVSLPLRRPSTDKDDFLRSFRYFSPCKPPASARFWRGRVYLCADVRELQGWALAGLRRRRGAGAAALGHLFHHHLRKTTSATPLPSNPDGARFPPTLYVFLLLFSDVFNPFLDAAFW